MNENNEIKENSTDPIIEKTFNNLVKESFEKIKSNLSESIISDISNSVKWRLKDEYAKVIEDFFVKEVSPKLQENLIKNKAIIIEAIDKELASLGKTIGDNIHERVKAAFTKNNSWEIKKIIDAIF